MTSQTAWRNKNSLEEFASDPNAQTEGLGVRQLHAAGYERRSPLLDSPYDRLLEDMGRFSALAANILDAYSTLIVLPSGLSELPSPTRGVPGESLTVISSHSLSSRLKVPCVLPAKNGVIGWVARTGRPVHLAHFDRDSSALGYYASNEPLKSFIAHPIVPPANDAMDSSHRLHGVLVADSRKSYAFGPVQQKILGQLCEQLSFQLSLFHDLRATDRKISDPWERFWKKSEALVERRGLKNVALFVVRLVDHESASGASFCKRAEEAWKFFACLRGMCEPESPFLVHEASQCAVWCLDRMLLSVLETRIEALSSSLRLRGNPLKPEMRSVPLSRSRFRFSQFESALDGLLAECLFEPLVSSSRESSPLARWRIRR